MPFGMVNASATFQRVMQDVLKSEIGKCCNLCINDVSVYASILEDLLKFFETCVHMHL